MKSVRRAALLTFLLAGLGMAGGCKSAHIEVSVVNHTAGPVRLLEVDYPNASFGSDALAAGAVYHYRIQVQGEGPVKVQYTAQDGHQVQLTGVTLSEGQQGALEILLLPNGRADFHPMVQTVH